MSLLWNKIGSRWSKLPRGARLGVQMAGVAMLVTCMGPATSQRLAPPGQLPPKTVLLSQMMRELSARPGFTDAMLDELQKQSKVGAALLDARSAPPSPRVDPRQGLGRSSTASPAGPCARSTQRFASSVMSPAKMLTQRHSRKIPEASPQEQQSPAKQSLRR